MKTCATGCCKAPAAFTSHAAGIGMMVSRNKSADVRIALLMSVFCAAFLIVIGRLKRKKLALKDEIARIEDFLNPDIIA